MLKELTVLFEKNEQKIEEWITLKKKMFSPLVYTSCDIRNSGFKVTTVDTNIFPAGWNNLCCEYRKKASVYFKDYFTKIEAKCVLILAEEHTRNKFYFSNLKSLQDLIIDAGFKVLVGSLNPEIIKKTDFETADGEILEVYPVSRVDDNICVENEPVCCILVNNDFSDGIPKTLENIKQVIVPNPELGWHKRKKSDHFRVYNQLVDEFAEIIGFDSWHFKTQFKVTESIDINIESDRQKMAQAVDDLILEIQKKYAEYGVQESPTVFIKNDAGTYGMGVISVKSGKEILELNRKNRNKLSVGKENVKISNFILQEGVPTTDQITGHTAEPVMYMVTANPVGGFFRVNESKSDAENLNSVGMYFVKMCFDKVSGYSNTKAEFDCDLECLCKIYNVVAILASLACGKEEFDLNN